MSQDLRKRYGFLWFLQGTPTVGVLGEEPASIRFIVDG